MRNQFVFAGLLVAATCTAPALAADLQRRSAPEVVEAAAPAATWTGFYTGVNTGWAWSSFHTGVDAFPAVSGFPQFVGTSVDGAMFGTVVGYNFQRGNWVLGLEGDFVDTSITGTQQAIGTPSGAVSATNRIEWLASARGRVGVLWWEGLVYGTAGIAWQQTTHDAMVVGTTAADIVSSSSSSTRTGFVVGAGYEWMLNQTWSVRAEYLFYDFGGTDTDAVLLPSGATVNSTTGTNTVHTIRFGANLRF